MTSMNAAHSKKASDRRYWPRMNGGLEVSYRIVSPADWKDVSKAWLSSMGLPPPGDAFQEPDPFMEFSVGGLRFDDVEGAIAGDMLIAVIQVPDMPTAWHVTLRVIRVDEIPPREREEPMNGEPMRTHRIAVQFEDIPKRATEALIEYTERLQDFEMAATADLITADILALERETDDLLSADLD